MMKKIYFLFILACIFLSSCGPKINQKQKQKLEQLTQSVDSVAVVVNAIDSAELISRVSDFFAKKNYVQNEMKDTLERETIFMLDAFVQLRKGMGYLQEQYIPIREEANIMQQQLIDLNHDVENRLIDEKKFDKYYQLEKDNFEQLFLAAGRLNEVNQKTLKAYNERLPKIDSLINAYKARLNE